MVNFGAGVAGTEQRKGLPICWRICDHEHCGCWLHPSLPADACLCLMQGTCPSCQQSCQNCNHVWLVYQYMATPSSASLLQVWSDSHEAHQAHHPRRKKCPLSPCSEEMQAALAVAAHAAAGPCRDQAMDTHILSQRDRHPLLKDNPSVCAFVMLPCLWS